MMGENFNHFLLIKIGPRCTRSWRNSQPGTSTSTPWHERFNPYHWVGRTCLVLRPLMLGLLRTSALMGPDNGTTTDGALGGMRRMSAHSVCFFFTSRPDVNLRWWLFTFKGNQITTVQTRQAFLHILHVHTLQHLLFNIFFVCLWCLHS